MGFASYSAVLEAIRSGRDRYESFLKTNANTIGGGLFQSLWGVSGKPPTGSQPGALTARQVDASTVGALNFQSPAGARDRFLRMFSARGNGTSQAGTLFVVDRLLDYGAISHTTAALQVLANPVTLPRYTDGDGVFGFLEVTTNLGATGVSCTFTYTNELGVGGRIGTATVAGSAIVTRIPFQVILATGHPSYFSLQTGDRGVRSVESVQFSGVNTAGVSNLVLVKPIFSVAVHTSLLQYERDAVIQMAALPELVDGHALQLISLSFSTVFAPVTYSELYGTEG